VKQAGVPSRWGKRTWKQADVAPKYTAQYKGVYKGHFGAALSFAGRIMLNTGHQIINWARESDCGVSSFATSCLATFSQKFLPYRSMVVERTSNTHDGFIWFRDGCTRCSNKDEL